MQSFKLKARMGLAGAVFMLASFAYGATITGTVTGPDGAPFPAAFVQARNAKTKITVMVLSDNNGRYRIENLPAGDCQVQARTIGFRSDPKSGIVLSASFLAKNFGIRPERVAALSGKPPGYKDTAWHFSDEGNNTVGYLYLAK
jgi:Carboxypeptidase regulatory-like domain